MDGANIQHLLAMILYMLAVIAIGIVFARRANKDAEAYFLGGRSLGPWVTAFSAEASDMSGYLLMGLPGLAYWTGLADAGWTCIGLALGTYLNFLITSRRLRRYSIAVDAFTVPDFFSKRYHEGRHKTLMVLSSLIIIIFFSVYAAQCLSTCGKLFANLFGLSYQSMMIVAAAFVLIYTFLGGFLAESASDFMQAVVMVTVLVLILIMSVGAAGGLSAAIQHAEGIDGFFSLVQSAAPSATEVDVFGAAKPYGVLSIVSCLAWGLGYFGMPQVLLRFMGIRSEKELKLSRRVAIVWVVISMAAAVFIGIVGRSIAGLDYLSNSDAENIFVDAAIMFLPPVLAGFACAGVLAAAISSSGQRRQPEPLSRYCKEGCHGEAGHVVLPHYSDAHHAGGHGHRLELQLHHLRHHRLCLGGLRRGLRPPDAVLPVLETYHPRRRHRRYGGRRRHGILLARRAEADGRCVGHLRAAARLPVQRTGHRGGLPADPEAQRRHGQRV